MKQLINQIKKNYFIFINIIFSFCLLIVMYNFQETNYSNLKVLLLGILCIELIYFSLVIIRAKDNISINIIKQFLYLSVLYGFFIFSAIMSNITIKDRIKSIITLYTIAIYLIILLTYLYWNKIHFSIRLNVQNIKLKVIQNKFIIFVVLFSLLIRVGQLGTIFRWDAGEYYSKLSSACYSFDFSIRQIFMNFGLCGHPMYGYALLNALGEFWFPQKMIGVQLVNLVLTLFAIKYIYVIFQKHLNINEKVALVFTLLTSVSATFLGTGSYFHPDYGIAIFVIFVIYFWLEKKYILMTFWACTLCMTKEIGVLLYASFAFSYLCVLLLSTKGDLGRRLKAVAFSSMLWVSAIPGGLYLLYMKLVGGVSSWRQNSEAGSNFVWNNNGENCFGFNLDYIIVKIKQLFLLNFKWIITILLFVMFIYSLYLYIKVKKRTISATFIAINIMCVMYCMFSFLYITAPLARYNIVFDLLQIILLAYLYSFISNNVINVHNKPAIVVPIICFTSVLCICQSYMSIDPVSSLQFKKLDSGAIPLIYPTWDTASYYGDYLVYNNQYTFIDRGYDTMLNNIGYDGQQTVFFPGNGAGLHINGNGQVYVINWDMIEKERTFSNGHNTVPINAYSIDSLNYLEESNNLSEKAVVFFLPYYSFSEATELEKLGAYYDVGKQNVYREHGGELHYYELTLKI